MIAKKVMSMDSGNWLLCCWDTCDRQGYELYKAVMENVTYVFCCERHKQYFLHSRFDNGMLPKGYRLMLQ